MSFWRSVTCSTGFAMQEWGIRLIGRGLWYLSAARTETEIAQAIVAARDVLRGGVFEGLDIAEGDLQREPEHRHAHARVEPGNLRRQRALDAVIHVPVRDGGDRR